MKTIKGIGNGCGCVSGTLSKQGEINSNAILFCNNFTPDMLLISKKVRGVIVVYGGVASHGFILLKQIGIPCVCLLGNDSFFLHEGLHCIVDSVSGQVIIND